MSLLFAAVADDDTGATDLAGMLAGQGLRPVLVIGLPESGQLGTFAAGCDALIIATGSRALAPRQAYERTREAVRALRTLRPSVIEIKYCSTFDSSPEGNIGPSIDAAMDETGEEFTIALPALPVNGRTTYMGYHFVHQQLLSDSPMRNHPLTPMTNPNLVSHLQSQTGRKVGLAPYPAVAAGARALRTHLAELRAGGVQIAVIDCITNAHLEVIARAIDDLPLITGSSAPAIGLPAVWARAGRFTPADEASLLPETGPGGSGILIAAGSCSRATRGQNAWMESRNVRSEVLDGVELASATGDRPFESVCGRAIASLCRGEVVLLRTRSEEEGVERVHRWARENGIGETEAGRRIACATAAVVSRIAAAVRLEGLILAGGETSGAITRALGFGALRVGRNIEPGVPLCVAIGAKPMKVVMKSGNFGGPDFYERAVAAIRRGRA